MSNENPFNVSESEIEIEVADKKESETEKEIESEVQKLKNNAENLRNKIGDYEAEDLENLNNEQKKGLVENTKKIIYGFSAMAAVAVASGLVPVEKISELNQNAKDFVNTGNNAFIIAGIAGALSLALIAYEFWEDYKKNKAET